MRAAAKDNEPRDGRVYVILINFRSTGDTINCLRSLSHVEHPDFHIVVVENGSEDGSAEIIVDSLGLDNGEIFQSLTTQCGHLSGTPMESADASRKIPVTLINSSRNLGYTGGNNLGIQFALEDQSARFVWLLNNDTEVDPMSLHALIKEHTRQDPAQREVAFTGSLILDYDNRDTIQALGGGFIGKFTGRTRGLLRGLKASCIPDDRPLPPPAYVTGASLIASVALIRRVGPLDDRYFLYWEDAEWSFRCKRLGYSLRVAPDSFVYHRKGSTTRRFAIVGYYETRNSLRFTWTYFPWHLPSHLILRPVIFGLISIKHGNSAFFLQCWRGYFAFISETLTGRFSRGSIFKYPYETPI